MNCRNSNMLASPAFITILNFYAKITVKLWFAGEFDDTCFIHNTCIIFTLILKMLTFPFLKIFCLDHLRLNCVFSCTF